MSKLLLKNSITSALPSMQPWPQNEALAIDESTAISQEMPPDLNVLLTDGNLPVHEPPLEDRIVKPASRAQAGGELSTNREGSVPKADSSTGSQLSSTEGTDGINSALVGSADERQPDSFVIDNWPYLLLAVVFIGWVFSRLLTRREPSFRPHVIAEKEKALIENPRGQFKKSERFLKPANKEESVEPDADKVEDASETKDETSEDAAEKSRPTDAKITESKLTSNQQADTMQTDQPSDEEFDFDLFEEGGDSDVFSLEDAAEIDEPVKDKSKGNSSKRFKTEADVDASLAKSDDMFVDDDEFVTFDDQDSQLSLADSDEEFGFDLDDEEPSNFLESGNLAAEVLPEAAQVVDEDADLADLGLDFDDDGLDDINLAGVEEAAQEVVEAVDSTGNPSVAAGMAAAAAAGGAAAAAKKEGFFSRLFGGKNKENADETKAEDSPVADEIASTSSLGATAESVDPADQIANVADDFDGSGALDVSETVESATDSLEMDEFENDPLDLVDSLDSDDDFDFDLEIDDELGEPEGLEEDAVDASSEDDAMDLVLLDSNEQELGLDDLSDDLGSVSDTGLDVAEASVVPAEQPITKPNDELEPSELLSSSNEAELSLDSDDSGELLFDLEDSSEVDASASAVELAVDDTPAVPAAQSPIEADEPTKKEAAVAVGQDESDDSDEFGLGVFDDETVQTVADESSDHDVETTITTPVVAAATAAVSAGIAGIAFAGTGSGKSDDSASKELRAKLSTLEDRNKELSAQVVDLKKQVGDAAKKNAGSASLQTELDEFQQQHKVLTETVDSLTSERDELVKEKNSIDSEKKRLSDELATATEQLSTWEQEKADLMKRQEELTAEKEAVAAELETAASVHEASATRGSQTRKNVFRMSLQPPQNSFRLGSRKRLI